MPVDSCGQSNLTKSSNNASQDPESSSISDPSSILNPNSEDLNTVMNSTGSEDSCLAKLNPIRIRRSVLLNMSTL